MTKEIGPKKDNSKEQACPARHGKIIAGVERLRKAWQAGRNEQAAGHTGLCGRGTYCSIKIWVSGDLVACNAALLAISGGRS